MEEITMRAAVLSFDLTPPSQEGGPERNPGRALVRACAGQGGTGGRMPPRKVDGMCHRE